MDTRPLGSNGERIRHAFKPFVARPSGGRARAPGTHLGAARLEAERAGATSREPPRSESARDRTPAGALAASAGYWST